MIEYSLSHDQTQELLKLAEQYYSMPVGFWRVQLMLADEYGLKYNIRTKTITGSEDNINWLLLHL